MNFSIRRLANSGGRWIVLVGLIWCAAGANALADDGPAMNRETAYRHLRRAEDAQQRNDWAAAVQELSMADAIYRVLIRTAPEWEQDYYQFRLETCERQLRLVERRSGQSREVLIDQEPEHSPLHEDRYRVLYHALRAENEALHRQVAQLEEEIELLLEMEEIERERAARRQASTPQPNVVPAPPPVPPAADVVEEESPSTSRPGLPILRERRPLPR